MRAPGEEGVVRRGPRHAAERRRRAAGGRRVRRRPQRARAEERRQRRHREEVAQHIAQHGSRRYRRDLGALPLPPVLRRQLACMAKLRARDAGFSALLASPSRDKYLCRTQRRHKKLRYGKFPSRIVIALRVKTPPIKPYLITSASARRGNPRTITAEQSRTASQSPRPLKDMLI